MKSTASVMDHPVHPMLIPYPFAFLSSVLAFDMAATLTRNYELSRTARHLTNAGLATALGAAVPGIIDYATAVPEGRPRRTATVHAISNLSALACFAAARAQRRDGRPARGVIALEAIGTALLSLGGWLGGNLVYHHQIGVEPEEQRLSSPAAARETFKAQDETRSLDTAPALS
jgi:uncharacterized membrane protein